MTLVLGDPAGNSITGRSAFIDNSHYAAIETPGGSSVQTGEIDHPNNVLIGQPTGYLVSGEQLHADGETGVLLFPSVEEHDQEPSTVTMTHQAFCQDCAFLKWGAWGARAGFVDPGYTDNETVVPASNVTADVHLGWWVAGDVVSDSDLPTDGSATYAGHAIGNVANNLNGQGAITYVATGDMGMSWSFNDRAGRFDITHFDTPNTGGLDFGGILRAPGVLNGNSFEGAITGQLPEHLPCVGCLPGSNALSGVANGSFARNPGQIAGEVPGGVIGNWSISNGQGNNTFTYGATGIFAGKGVP
jgi:hypothetical protein